MSGTDKPKEPPPPLTPVEYLIAYQRKTRSGQGSKWRIPGAED